MSGAPQILFWVLLAALTAGTVLILVRPVARSPRLRQAITAIVPLAALGLYLWLGRPDLLDWRIGPRLPPALVSAVEKLRADTAEHPDDATAWILLAQVDRKLEHYAEAEDCYRHAIALTPDDLQLKPALGEVLVAQAGGAVTAPALALFRLDPDSTLSRYHVALATAQSGDWGSALAQWQKLADASAQDAPWQASVRDRMGEARQALDLDAH